MGTTNGTSPLSMDIGSSGMAASHPVQLEFPRRVAPSDSSDATHNTIKPFLTVVGCVLMPNDHFAFDSSFVVTDMKKATARLARLRDELAEPSDQVDQSSQNPPAPAKPPISVFGHCDPVGSDQYNSVLSQRRARAVYAILVRDPSEWEWLADNPHGRDKWGQTHYDTMRTETGIGSAGDPIPKGADRKALITAYMDKLCVTFSDDQNPSAPYTLDKKADFLARGAGQFGKGDLQGCSEFNPRLVISTDRMNGFFKGKTQEQGEKERDAVNEINRRVIVFLFKPNTVIDPTHWPCPHVRDGNAVSVCTGRFWTDGNKRRHELQSLDKVLGRASDTVPSDADKKISREPTFACRFYYGLAQNSPCEGLDRVWVLRFLWSPPIVNKKDRPVANTRYLATMGDAANAPMIRGRTDADGVVRLPVFDDKATIKFKLDVGDIVLPPGVKPPDDSDRQQREKDEANFTEFTLQAGDLLDIDKYTTEGNGDDVDDQGLKAVKQRLFNLGYGKGDLSEWDDKVTAYAITAFQENEQLQQKDGKPNFEMRTSLQQVHDYLPNSDPNQAPDDKPMEPEIS